MAITLSGLTPQVQTNIGLLAGTKTYRPYPYWNIFKSAGVLPIGRTGNVEFDYLLDSVVTAKVNKRGNNKAPEKVADREFRRVSLTPTEIFASQSLTASELLQMQPGSVEIMTVGGKAIPSSEQVIQRKLQRLRDSIDARKNIMCTQLLDDGKVYAENGNLEFDFNIPAAVSASYSTSDGFLKLVKDINREYIKNNNGMPADRFLIGSDIADALLQDEKLQTTMYHLGYTNVGQNLTSDEKSRVIGVFMGQNIEEMAYSFNEKGINIIEDNTIKLLNTGMLAQGYAAIEIQNTQNLPDYYLGDEFIDVQPGDKLNPTAFLFAKSGFMPVVIDPISIQTYNVTIS